MRSKASDVILCSVSITSCAFREDAEESHEVAHQTFIFLGVKALAQHNPENRFSGWN